MKKHAKSIRNEINRSRLVEHDKIITVMVLGMKVTL